MKQIITALLFFTSAAYAQQKVKETHLDFSGNWHIDHLIGLSEENEYLLTASDEPHIYGNSANMSPHGTFTSAYSAKCGNDCFVVNSGTCEWIDKDHISFMLEEVLLYGECSDTTTHPHKDMGLFYVSKDSSTIKLIKSTGDLKSDLRNLKYSRLIDQFDQETSKVFNLHYLPWEKTEFTTAPDLVKEYIASNPAANSDVKMLFSKKIRDYFTVMLLEEKGTYHYLVYDLSNGNVALYNPDLRPK